MYYKNGLHDISIEDYHSSDGVSRSSLMLMLDSPFHYHHRHLTKFTSSPAKDLGSMVHCLILEPHLFKDEFICKPVPTVLDKAKLLKDIGKEAFEQQKIERAAITTANEVLASQFEELSKGKIVFTQAMLTQAQEMVDSFYKFGSNTVLFEEITAEQSIYWEHPCGLQFKARPDAWNKSSGYIIDLKTTQSVKTSKMQRSCLDYGYYMQAAMIKAALTSLGEPMTQYLIAGIEKTQPYASNIFIVDEEALAYGARQFDKAAYLLASCLEKDEWPGHQAAILTIPEYLKVEE